MSSARCTTEIDPVHVVFPDSEMMALTPLSPKLPETDPWPWACCEIRQPAAIAGQSVTSANAAQ
jgi:hypothetical protein